MKKVLLIILAGWPVFTFAQTTYTIKGKVGNVNAPSKIYLTYRDDARKSIVDSALIKDGAFTFNGTVNDVTPATLVLDYKGIGLANLDRKARQDELALYLADGTTTLTSADSLSKATITGSVINVDNAAYKAFTKPADDKMDKLMAEHDTTPAETRQTPEWDKAFDARYDAVENEQRQLASQFITAHPNSYVSLLAIYDAGGNYPEYTDVAPLYNSLSADIKNTIRGKKYAIRLEKLKLVAIGSLAPEFAQADTSGKVVSLSSFRGKYLLIDFWASWCGPCRAENPNVVKAFNKYKDKNFTILGVSLDRPGAKDKWLAAIKKDGLAWTQVSDLQWWNNAASTAYGIQAIPQNFLLDPTGKIIGKNLRGDDLEKKLEELFGKI